MKAWEWFKKEVLYFLLDLFITSPLEELRRFKKQSFKEMLQVETWLSLALIVFITSIIINEMSKTTLYSLIITIILLIVYRRKGGHWRYHYWKEKEK